jgi:hypothetical protein
MTPVMNAERLQELLRSAVPPAHALEPSQDLWPLVVNRIQAPRGWSQLDVSLAAIVVMLLLMFPGWLFLLAYHL